MNHLNSFIFSTFGRELTKGPLNQSFPWKRESRNLLIKLDSQLYGNDNIGLFQSIPDFLSLLIICAFFAFSNVCLAGHNDEHTFVSPSLYKKLKKAESLIARKDYAAAQQKLLAMHSSVKKGGFEEATVLRSLSSVYALRRQYGKAADALSRCLALKALPSKQEQQALLNLGQLYMATDQYRKAVGILENWLATNQKGDAQIYILLANAYAQLKQYRKALPYVEKAIQSTKKPNESWLKLSLALHYELNNYQASAKVLQKLIRYFPDKKEYWDQASSVYQQLKQYKKAVTIKHLGYKKGLYESEKEILSLVNLFMYVDAPYKAAKILDKEIKNRRVKSNSKNWELLANAWTQAREFDHAITALETASKLNEKGILYQQLGNIYVEQEKWSKAIDAFTKSLAKGGIKQPGNTYILLGISQSELKNYQEARKFFTKAKAYKKTRKTAVQWLNYINETTLSNS